MCWLYSVPNLLVIQHLETLYLGGVALPKTICNLCNLQILHIEIAGGFQKLPQGMDKLINLRHFKLDCKTYRDPNINFPRGFGRLTSLRTLDRKSTRLNSSHNQRSRMPSSA